MLVNMSGTFGVLEAHILWSESELLAFRCWIIATSGYTWTFYVLSFLLVMIFVQRISLI
uniref:Uncharacterized protein n=1 Tax=Rhizophora mucronata TaxID=61149 RepID=A0A2P2NKQ7_RHIMU